MKIYTKNKEDTIFIFNTHSLRNTLHAVDSDTEMVRVNLLSLQSHARRVKNY